MSEQTEILIWKIGAGIVYLAGLIHALRWEYKRKTLSLETVIFAIIIGWAVAPMIKLKYADIDVRNNIDRPNNNQPPINNIQQNNKKDFKFLRGRC